MNQLLRGLPKTSPPTTRWAEGVCFTPLCLHISYQFWRSMNTAWRCFPFFELPLNINRSFLNISFPGMLMNFLIHSWCIEEMRRKMLCTSWWDMVLRDTQKEKEHLENNLTLLMITSAYHSKSPMGRFASLVGRLSWLWSEWAPKTSTIWQLSTHLHFNIYDNLELNLWKQGTVDVQMHDNAFSLYNWYILLIED